MSLISVIIPVFNGEQTIKEAIESVLNQTFSDLELIVIDDGSSDSTLNILSRVRDLRLKVFSYANAGVCVSRNRGFSHASGEFISFLDADDLWTLDKLEAQLEALNANPEAAVAYSWVDYMDPTGKFFRDGSHINANGNIYEEILVKNILENGSNPLIRRQALVKVGGFNQRTPLVGDWDMWLRLSVHYHFVAVPRPQVLYRMSSNSASTNVLRMEAEALQLIKEAFKQAPQSMQHLKKRSLSTLYNYLTFKALETPSARKNGLIATRFFGCAIENDWSTLWQWKTMLKALFKVAVVTSLPPQRSQALMKATKQIVTKKQF
jgi:glycosyltransferase involved in cell wall biosynthesis